MTPAIAILQKVLAAYGSQRDPINDSDLDNEQPITLTVYLNLGELRRVRMAVIGAGHRPADFDTKPRTFPDVSTPPTPSSPGALVPSRSPSE